MILASDVIDFITRESLQNKDNFKVDFNFASKLNKKDLICLLALLTYQESLDLTHSIKNANEWGKQSREDILKEWFLTPDLERI